MCDTYCGFLGIRETQDPFMECILYVSMSRCGHVVDSAENLTRQFWNKF